MATFLLAPAAIDPATEGLCPHTLLVREGPAVRCVTCGTTAPVPRCLGCRERTCKGCNDRACTSCQGKPTTWLVRPPHLVCYKCGRSVPGLAPAGVVAEEVRGG